MIIRLEITMVNGQKFNKIITVKNEVDLVDTMKDYIENYSILNIDHTHYSHWINTKNIVSIRPYKFEKESE